MPDLVQYQHVGSVAIITINRPEKRNALSRALIAALSAAFERAADDPLARSVVLTGNGPAFCAGMDLDELRGTLTSATVSTPSPSGENLDEAGMVWDDAQKLSALYERIFTLPKPTIAAVNGAAVAGGAGLLTVCDLAISVPTAKFGYPEVRRGLVAAMVMPHLLRHVGERTARLMLLTGAIFDAAFALQCGLINEVVETPKLLETAIGYCKQMAEGGPKAIATTKDLLRRCSRQALSIDDLAKASAEPRLTDECRGGLEAFFANKPLPWAEG